MALQIGITTGELLSVLERWKRDGRLRRIGAIVNHFSLGLGGGAMVVWRVEPERVGAVGEVFAGFEEVSHAYERRTAENWPYNLYTMVHAAGAEETRRIVARMSSAANASDYRILDTKAELKKVPPTYVIEEQ